MPEWPGLMALVEPHAHLWASVGVHPDYEDTPDPSVEELVRLSAHPAWSPSARPGWTTTGCRALDWQRERFRRHIARRARPACR